MEKLFLIPNTKISLEVESLPLSATGQLHSTLKCHSRAENECGR